MQGRTSQWGKWVGLSFLLLMLWPAPGRAAQQMPAEAAILESLKLQSPDTTGRISQAFVVGDHAYLLTAGRKFPEVELLKMELPSLKLVDKLTLKKNHPTICSAAASGRYAYFGTCGGRGQIFRVDLQTFRKSRVLNLPEGDENLATIVFDGDFGYFGTFGETPRVVKVDLQRFKRVGSIDVDQQITGAIAFKGKGYFAISDNETAEVLRIDLAGLRKLGSIRLAGTAFLSLQSGKSGFFVQRVRGIDFDSEELVQIDLPTWRVRKTYKLSTDSALSGAIVGNKAYFGMYGEEYNGRRSLMTLDLPSGRHTSRDMETPTFLFTHQKRLYGGDGIEYLYELNRETGKLDRVVGFEGETQLSSAVVDGGFAYLVTATDPGTVIKLDLTTFTRVDALSFGFGEWDFSATFAQDGILHLVADRQIARVDLGSFQKLDSLVLPREVETVLSAIPGDGFVDVASFEGIFRIDLQSGTRIAKLPAANSSFHPAQGFIAGDFEYFIGPKGDFDGVRLMKVDRASLESEGEIELAGEYAFSAGILVDGRYAYIGINTTPRTIVKVDLQTFRRVATLKLDLQDNPQRPEDDPEAAVLEREERLASAVALDGFAYFTTTPLRSEKAGEAGSILKIDLSSFRLVDTTRVPDQGGLTTSFSDSGMLYFGTFDGFVVKTEVP